MNNQPSSLLEIARTLNTYISESSNDSVQDIASYIVGSTLVNDNIDQYYADYPILHKIEEVAADLETVPSDNTGLTDDLYNELKLLISQLYLQVNTKIR